MKELIYIGDHSSRFIKGDRYKVISFSDNPNVISIILDKDFSVPFEIFSDLLLLDFVTPEEFRDDQINKILT
jgi:hypothetical protein